MTLQQQNLEPDQDQEQTKNAKLHPKDRRPSDEAHLSAYDKEVADSFPASDPPSQP